MALDTLLLEDGSALLLEDGSALLLESATEDVSAPLGGTFRRASATWARVLVRQPRTWPRTATRTRSTWDRVWRYRPMPLPTEGDPITAAVSDDREYAFDLQHSPELRAAGVTIESGAITGGAGLTIGTPAVITEPFDGIPPGRGVKVRISGGTAGVTYKFACVVTLSSGRKVTVPARLTKVPDHDA